MAKQTKSGDIELLRGCALFGRLSDEQLAALAAKMRPVTFKRGATIFHKDDPGDELYVIRSGRVKISVISPEGKDLIINIYGPGEVFGEMSMFDELPRSALALAAEKVEALELGRGAFEELLGGVPGLAVSIIRLLSRRLRYTTEQTALLGLFGAYERVALKLLQLAPPSDEPYSVSLSQGELAAMVGLTREWLNKVLNIFVDHGIIELTRGSIHIRDVAALRRWV